MFFFQYLNKSVYFCFCALQPCCTARHHGLFHLWSQQKSWMRVFFVNLHFCYRLKQFCRSKPKTERISLKSGARVFNRRGEHLGEVEQRGWAPSSPGEGRSSAMYVAPQRWKTSAMGSTASTESRQHSGGSPHAHAHCRQMVCWWHTAWGWFLTADSLTITTPRTANCQPQWHLRGQRPEAVMQWWENRLRSTNELWADLGILCFYSVMSYHLFFCK